MQIYLKRKHAKLMQFISNLSFYCSGSKLWVALEPYKHNIKPSLLAAQWVASLPLGWTLFIRSRFESQLGPKPSSKCVDC